MMKTKRRKSVSYRISRKNLSISQYFYGGSHILDLFGTGVGCSVDANLRPNSSSIEGDFRAIGKDLYKVLARDVSTFIR